MRNLPLLSFSVFLSTAGAIFATPEAARALLWNWSYSGTGISASGTFTTVDTPDLSGFYLITAITGTRNGETITGLSPAGSPIPGNEPFDVDNLVRIGPGSQLTGDGFGYSTSGGNFVSPFFASFLPVPGYLEVFSAPPFIPGFENFGPEDSELPITFSASPILVPEPTSTIGFLALGSAAFLLNRKRKTATSTEKERENVS